MKRKLLSVLLALCMMVSLFPTAAFADGPTGTEGTESTEPSGGTETPPTNTEGTGEEGGQPTTPPEGDPEPEPTPEPTTPTIEALEVVASVDDADTDKKDAQGKEQQFKFYNVLFANGQDVVVEPAEEGNGLLVTVGDKQYSYATNSAAFRTNSSDGLTIFAGTDGSKTNEPAAIAGGSAITIKKGACVGAIFAGGYKTSSTSTVDVLVEDGAKVGTLYGGGMTPKNDKESVCTTEENTITVDGEAGLIYAGGRASVGPTMAEVVTFDAAKPAEATAKNWVGKSSVVINGTVGTYMGGCYSYGGVGEVNCTLNGKLTSSYSAICGTNGYRGTATLTVNKGAEIKNDLYCSMRGYVGDTILENAGTIGRVSLNPDGKAVSSYGNTYVKNTGTITTCNLDCGCEKVPVLDSNISSYPRMILVSGNVTVDTTYWEEDTGHKGEHYTGIKGQAIVLTDGAKLAEGQTISNLAVAKVGDMYYGSLQEAVTDAKAAATTITMVADATGNVTVESNQNITIDLNGKTLTNKDDNTITNKGTLKIIGEGTVDNVTHEKASLLNDEGATAVLEGGTYTRSKETGAEAQTANTFCNILNKGTMTIGKGVTVEQEKALSTLVENGAKASGEPSTQAANAPKLTINGGTFKGGLVAIENNAGELTVTGGTFTAATTLLNSSKATVKGGNFAGEITTATEGDGVSTAIENGNFTADPSKYLAEGKIAVASTEPGYTYTVGDKPKIDTDVAVKPAAPEVEIKVDSKLTEAEKTAITTAIEKAEANGLEATAGSVITKLDTKTAIDAVSQLAAALGDEDLEANAVTLVVQPYMDIKVTEYKADADADGEKVMTLDITPMYQLVATTADDPDDINLEDGQGQGQSKNAVKVGKPAEMKVETPVKIEVPVPSDLFTADTNLYVKHTKGNGAVYYYKATLITEQSSSKISFTTEHGFSPFAISEDTRNATVNFVKDENTTEEVTYKPSDVSTAFPTATKSGYDFDGWKFKDVEGATGTYKTLTDSLLTALSKQYAKDSTAIEATPEFSDNSSWDFGGGGSTGATYIITASAGQGGTITPSGKVSVSSGSDKTFTIAPATGYAIADVKVDGESVGAVKTYTFEDVKKSHTIEASFQELDAEGVFTDVKADDWFYDAVQYAYTHELMNGVGGGKFEPNATTNRGMIVTILYRLEKEPTAQAARFADVAADAYYADAVAWAAEKGIVKGYSDTQFGPNDAITREQMASILYRYAQLKGYDVSGKAELTGFTDASSISDYAVEAMQWANGQKLIQGVTTSTIQPQGSATRAQVATILMRFIENVAK